MCFPSEPKVSTSASCRKNLVHTEGFSAKTKQMRKRSVRFNVVVDKASNEATVKPQVMCMMVPSSEMTMEEKGACWWQPSDHEHIKGTARMVSSEIRKQYILASMGQARKNDYCQVLIHSYDLCSPNNEDGDHNVSGALFSRLVHWARVGHVRRGLERWTSPEQTHLRQSDRNKLISAVLNEQKQINSSELACREERLREVSEMNSRRSKTYARIMGEADAAAALQQENKTRCQSLEEIKSLPRKLQALEETAGQQPSASSPPSSPTPSSGLRRAVSDPSLPNLLPLRMMTGDVSKKQNFQSTKNAPCPVMQS